MKLQLPAKVRGILEVLNAHGYEAYAVGGCVRDSILARSPDDWDITTSATPMEVKALFSRTVDTGLQHGTVTVLKGGEGFEVTTYRVDGAYEDGRHPKEVIYTSSLAEDLRRRDFTINAMAYNPRDGLVDLYGGMEDLQKGVVRCVGDPMERFSEDALRLLRAVRFCAQLGFSMEEGTRQAIFRLAPRLSCISAERIQTELVKLLLSPHPEYLRMAWEAGITREILPEFDAMMETPQHTPHHCCSVGEHTLKSLTYVRAQKALRLTMLLHDVGKPQARTTDAGGRDHFKGHGPVGQEMAEQILLRLKMDRATTETVKRLVQWHDYRPNPTEEEVRRAVYQIGEEIFPLYLEVQRADMLAQSQYKREEKEQRQKGVACLYEKILREKQCVSLKTLALTGKDLLTAGMSPGPDVGRVLAALLDEVLEEPSRNHREYLLARAAELMEKI